MTRIVIFYNSVNQQVYQVLESIQYLWHDKLTLYCPVVYRLYQTCSCSGNTNKEQVSFPLSSLTTLSQKVGQNQ